VQIVFKLAHFRYADIKIMAIIEDYSNIRQTVATILTWGIQQNGGNFQPQAMAWKGGVSTSEHAVRAGRTGCTPLVYREYRIHITQLRGQ
jgi:hypothetical protein